MDLSDIFLFIGKFYPEEVIKFKKEFLTGFESIDTYYECPKYSQETIFETESFIEMFDFVLEKPGRPYTFYFESELPNKIRGGVIQINKNGSICLALSAEPCNEKYCIELLRKYYLDYPIFISNNIPLPSSEEELINR